MVGVGALTTVPANDLFLLINARHNQFFDVFFYIITQFGGVLWVPAAILILAFKSLRWAIAGSFALFLQAAMMQSMKWWVFSDRMRPHVVLSEEPALYLVEWYTRGMDTSFPSGHTATAFCAFALFALAWRNANWNFLFLIIAALVAYSRMYLAQHFFHDVYAGSILGTGMAVLIYHFLVKEQVLWKGRPHLERPLFRMK